MNIFLLGLFNYKYSEEELKRRIINVLSNNILLSNNSALRDFHVKLFEDFEWYENSKYSEIREYPYLVYSEYIVGIKNGQCHKINTIEEFIKAVESVPLPPKVKKRLLNGRVIFYDNGSVFVRSKVGDGNFSREEFLTIIEEYKKIFK